MLAGHLEKLRGERGAALVMALVYFLICAVVGSVILAAARANLSHDRGRIQLENDYLAVMSGAELLKNELKDNYGSWICEHGEQDQPAGLGERLAFRTEMLGQIQAEASMEGFGSRNRIAQTVMEGIYESYLKSVDSDTGLLKDSFGEYETFSSEIIFQVQEDMEGKWEFPDVTAKIKVAPDYGAADDRDSQRLHFRGEAELSLDEREEGEQYHMVIEFSGTIEYHLEEIMEVEERTVTREDGTQDVETMERYFYTSISAITWNPPMIRQSTPGKSAARMGAGEFLRVFP